MALTIAGAEFTLTPSFAALAEIEQRAGMGLVALAQRFAEGRFGLADVMAVLVPAIKAGGSAVPERLGDGVVQTGIAPVAVAIARFLARALTGEVAVDMPPASADDRAP